MNSLCRACPSPLPPNRATENLCNECLTFYNTHCLSPPDKCAHKTSTPSCPSCRFSLCTATLQTKKPSYSNESNFVERIIFCESLIEPSIEAAFAEDFVRLELDTSPFDQLLMAMENRLNKVNYWASVMPWFSTELNPNDRATLIKNCWMEIILLTVSYRSTFVKDCLLFHNENSKIIQRFSISKNLANQMGLDSYAERILTQIVGKLRDLSLDRIELCLVRATLLFNPELPNLSPEAKVLVEKFRDNIHSALNIYCSQSKAQRDPNRFTKILMKLNQIKPIALKCVEYFVMLESISKNNSHDKILNLIRDGSWTN